IEQPPAGGHRQVDGRGTGIVAKDVGRRDVVVQGVIEDGVVGTRSMCTAATTKKPQAERHNGDWDHKWPVSFSHQHSGRRVDHFPLSITPKTANAWPNGFEVTPNWPKGWSSTKTR